jgi:hypothetical protein
VDRTGASGIEGDQPRVVLVDHTRSVAHGTAPATLVQISAYRLHNNVVSTLPPLYTTQKHHKRRIMY